MKRILIFRMLFLVMPYILQAFEEEVKKTPNPYDDMILKAAQDVFGAIKSGELKIEF